MQFPNFYLFHIFVVVKIFCTQYCWCCMLLHLYGHYVLKKLLFCIWSFVVSTLLDRECVIYEKKSSKRTFYMYYASDTCFQIMNIKSRKSMRIKEVSHDSSLLFLLLSFFFTHIYFSQINSFFFWPWNFHCCLCCVKDTSVMLIHKLGLKSALYPFIDITATKL